MARASASAMPGMRPCSALAPLTAVRRSPRSALPTRANGRSSGKAPPLLFSRSSGRWGRKMETIRLMTELHDETLSRRLAPAALKRHVPGGSAWCRRIEGGKPAPPRRDAPARERARQPRPPARAGVTGEEETGRARDLRGKAEAAPGKLFPDLGLPKCCDERPALKPLFQRPGGILRRPGLDDEETRGVEAVGDEARPVRAPPFARRVLGQAPEHEIAPRGPGRVLSDRGEGEGESARGVAVGGRLDLVQPCLLQLG